MTYRRLRRHLRNPFGASQSTFSSPAEVPLFVATWCDAVGRMTRLQLQDSGIALLDVWHDCVDGSDAAVDRDELEELKPSQLPPLLLDLAANHVPPRAPKPTPLDRRIEWLAGTLGLDPVERSILTVLARHSAHDEWIKLIGALPGKGDNPSPRKIAMVTGINVRQIEDRLASGRRLWSTGLVSNDCDGEYSATQLLVRIARSSSGPARLGRQLMPVAPRSTLTWEDFEHIGPQREICEALVAKGDAAPILLYGPPGTGKTEFARLLVDRTGKRAVFAGLTDDEGAEPSRRERLAHLTVVRALTRNDPTRIVVMDEADDILMLGGEDDRASRSKLFLNRLIEGGDRPTIWIVNEPGMLEESIVRRMMLAIEFPRPPMHVRRRIIERHSRKARLSLNVDETAQLAAIPAAPALIASAIRGAKQAGGSAAHAQTIGEGLASAVNGRPPEPWRAPQVYDPALALADVDLDALAARLTHAPERGWSLLLSGPSGTGKSAFARHLAERLGVELIERRGSDLLSMFLGQTEARIAKAFREAAQAKALLLIDEADDFLFDRRAAVRSWERSMVNEMLRQMEALHAPFVATTNLSDQLDPATQRRFTMRATFQALDPARAAGLYARYFGKALPAGEVLHAQTPGDFAVVAKRAALLGEADADTLLAWLRAEADARGDGGKAMGF